MIRGWRGGNEVIRASLRFRWTEWRKAWREQLFADMTAPTLKRRAVRGGVVVLISQALKFGLRIASMMILARLLAPEDFGLQGMVATMSGVLGLFRDVGLSTATVQRERVSVEATSTLFWLNVAVGGLLAGLLAASAPILVAFYEEPRLYGMAGVSGLAFVFNGLAMQHQALLQRNMRFVPLAVIEVSSLAVSGAVGVVMALWGWTYWALVGMAVSGPLIIAIGSWLALPWCPRLPSRASGVRSMVRSGGTLTLNSLVVYLSYNAEKILLGKVWGPDALGLYGRAYQLVSIVPEQLNSSLGAVAVPALSRLQGSPGRLSTYFLKSYSVALSLTIPVTITGGLFAEEVIALALGEQWAEAAHVFRLLCPMVLAFALVNPFSWFLIATARFGRSLRMAILIGPVVIIGILLGLPHGPAGVALGYSLSMVLLVVPLIAWARRGTMLSGNDVWAYARVPLLAGVVAGAVGLAVKVMFMGAPSPALHLLAGSIIVFGSYAAILLVTRGQRNMYADLLRQALQRRGSEGPRGDLVGS